MTFNLYVMNASIRFRDLACSIDDIVLRQHASLPPGSQAHLVFGNADARQKALAHLLRCGIACSQKPFFSAPIIGPITIKEPNDVAESRRDRSAVHDTSLGKAEAR